MGKELKARAGRKPKGEYAGKSAVFSTRITPELRAMLEEEAERTGRSISQVVERRLRDSFDRPKHIDRALGPKHVRALAYAVAKMASGIEAATGRQWHTDAFTGLALQAALKIATYYLGSSYDLSSKGEVEVPHRVESHIARIAATMGSLGNAEKLREPSEYGISRATDFIGALQHEMLKGDPDRMWFDSDSYDDFRDDSSLLSFIISNLNPPLDIASHEEEDREQ